MGYDYHFAGSQPGELQDESFSAIGVTVTFHGVDVHPGWADVILVNAAKLAGIDMPTVTRFSFTNGVGFSTSGRMSSIDS